jgi:hypothetical protein
MIELRFLKIIGYSKMSSKMPGLNIRIEPCMRKEDLGKDGKLACL